MEYKVFEEQDIELMEDVLKEWSFRIRAKRSEKLNDLQKVKQRVENLRRIRSLKDETFK